MTSEIFLITGGGTGAKVAEAFIHLCAAGLGPKKAHLLLIDSDTANGNLARATDTARAYQKMQKWPWSVRADVRQGPLGLRKSEVWLEMFGTELHVYQLTEPIQTVHGGGLGTLADSEPMRLLLDLLYDADEQETDCSDGFRARPNLGCLLLAEHLETKLPETARAFLAAMHTAARNSQDRVPVVVSASVFGGTGASLLPIARRAVETALERHGLEKDQLRHFEWSAVMLLPHYQPNERQDSVDPDRFLLDTASALQFYSTVYDTPGEASRYDTIFVVGSDNPGRNRVKAVLGEGRQANPAYFEEFLAALGVLRCGDARSVRGMPMRVYAPETVSWENLPHHNWQELREKLAFVLHLAAFYMRRGSGATYEQLTLGIARMLRNVGESDLMKFAWYTEILDRWAEFHDAYKAAERSQRAGILRNSGVMLDHSFPAMLTAAAEYFGRLLLWAETALQGPDLAFVEHATDEDYAGLYGVMSKVKAGEIEKQRGEGNEVVPIQPGFDNALVRVLRTAATAMVHEHRQPSKQTYANGHFVLIDHGLIRLRTTSQQINETLRELEFGSMIEEYRKTSLS
jgi:hypothetical protein